MLDSISPYLDQSKGEDLKRRFENKRPEQALPAEIEIALLWGLAEMGDIEIEPQWFDAKRLPDVHSDHLFADQPAIIEIAGLSDLGLSGEVDMRRAASRIGEAANRVSKKCGEHLFFHFREERGYGEHGEFLRRRKVASDFTVSEDLFEQLSCWLKRSPKSDGERLELKDSKVDVVVEWKEQRQGKHNYHCSMPSMTYSVTDNPLRTLLSHKSAQLRNPDYRGIRCLLIGDAGSTLLRRLVHYDPTNQTISGKSIIEDYFFTDSCGLDVVCVFSPFRKPTASVFWQHDSLTWKVTHFVRPGIDLPRGGLERLAASLPKPQFEGYQAWSRHQQGAFSHLARGHYVGTLTEGDPTSMKTRISARALIDLLAGRITQDQFLHFTNMKKHNAFRISLDSGQTIKSLQIESGGMDEDDDWIVVEFGLDPGAARIMFNKESSTEAKD